MIGSGGTLFENGLRPRAATPARPVFPLPLGENYSLLPSGQLDSEACISIEDE